MDPNGYISSPGGILVQPADTKPVLDGPTAEYLRVLHRDYREAPSGTPEPISAAYVRMAAALIDAEQFRLILPLPDLTQYWLQRYAVATLKLISQATMDYKRAELHLQKPNPEGEDPFREVMHRLDNVYRLLSLPVHVRVARMSGNCPPLDASRLLDAMRYRVAAIVLVKTAKPQRVGDNYLIEGYTLELSDQTATLLELGLRSAPLDEVYEKLGIAHGKPPTEITARIDKLKTRLRTVTEITPFRIDVAMKKPEGGTTSQIIASIKPKMLPKR